MGCNNVKKILSSVFAAAVVAGMMVSVSYADNPIVQTIYTADVAPMVHDGVVYAYSGHDEDTADGWFDMREWRCYSSTDMANWTDCGSSLDYTVFEWAGGDAWAAQCIQSKKDGKFYFYAPVMHKDGMRVLGVAVSESPTGPFRDAIGKPLFEFGIDPTVYIDDDGKVYLYWGGGNELFYVILDEDMITPLCEPVKVDLASGINGPGGSEDDFYEAPWLTKRGDTYYMIYSGNIPEAIYYATSDSPTGPWEHKGKIMDNQGWVPFTSHVGVVDYKDNSYIFYHNAKLPGGYGYHRSIAAEEFKYNDDGSIPFIPYTDEGPKQIESLDPYVRTEAETIAWEEGIETESFGTRGVDYGVNVYDIDDGDYIKVKGVDFKDGAASFAASVACGFNKGSIELHLDSVGGDLIGTLPVSYTGGENKWKEIAASVSGASGKHDLYLVFKGEADSDLFKFDYWRFEEKSGSKRVTALRAQADTYKIDTIEGKNTANIKISAIYEDGSEEDVTEDAIITSESGNISINGASVTGTQYGPAIVNVSYGGKTDTVELLVKDLDTEVTAKSLTAGSGVIEIISGTSLEYTLTAEFMDGHTEDVTALASAEYDTDMLEIDNGRIKAKSVGATKITFSYKGEKGDAVTADLKVTIVTLDPFIQNEAEDFHEFNNVQVESCNEGGDSVGYIENGSWLMFGGIDFGSGAKVFEARLASETSGGVIELYLDSMDGTPIGTLSFNGSGGWQNWVTKSCAVTGAEGVHNLYMKFTGGSGNLMNINWWRFADREIPEQVNKVTSGGNPIINTDFYADPSCRVFDGKMYIYGSHDIDTPNWFNMRDYRIWSSEDGATWTNSGIALAKEDVPWVDKNLNTMWAPDCVFKDGLYYLFFPSTDKNGINVKAYEDRINEQIQWRLKNW